MERIPCTMNHEPRSMKASAYYHWVQSDRHQRAIQFGWDQRKGRKRGRPVEVQDEPEDHKPVSVEKSVKKVNFFRRAANAMRRVVPFV